MTLESDTRGRVPFALVGVLLLVSSAAYTGGLATHDTIADRTPEERVLATATTATHAAVEQASLDASETAGAHPLNEPADSPMGHVLEGPDPFERYLRVLVYRHARRSIRNVSAATGGVTVGPQLPPIRSPADARDAINRTQVERVDDGRRLRVTIQRIPFTLSRDGTRIGTHRENISVVVASPILALHDRTSTFDRRLNAGPIDGPGLGRRLTARLLLLAQARGMAQYGKAPIANVLANRHVELQTNGAAVTLQRDAFGTADPASKRALIWATGRVGFHDILAGASKARDSWSESVLNSPATATPDATAGALEPPDDPSPQRSAAIRRPADRALVTVLDGDSSRPFADTTPLERAVDDAYTLDAVRLVESRAVSRTTNQTGERPSEGALASTDTSTTTSVALTTPGPSTPPSGFDIVELVGRRVVETERIERVWRTPTGTNRTVETTTTVMLVDLGVATRYRPSPAPDRPVDLSDARRQLDAAAATQLLGSTADRDALARRAVAGRVGTEIRTVSVQPPEAAYRAARAAVLDTHLRARELSGAVDASPELDSTGRETDSGTSGSESKTDATMLADALEENRSRLLATPSRYSGPLAVARTNARRVYLDELDGELSTDETRLSRTGGGLQQLLDDRNLAVPSVDSHDVPGRTKNGMAVSVTPSYLPVTEVTPRMADIDKSYHPLAARNVNLFTVPSGDVADSVASAVVPDSTSTVDVAVAARALAAAEKESLPVNQTLDNRRHELRVRVETATDSLAHSQTRTLARTTTLSAGESTDLVSSTLDAYPSVSARALAMTNGTVSETLAERAARRTTTNQSVLAARLRVAVENERTNPDARVPDESINATSNAVRDVAREGTRKLVENGLDHAAERAKHRALTKSMAALPAGMPIAPVPGSWYFTVNVWVVDVRGAYHRVEATSVVASPSFGPDGLSYVRETGAVSIDVDGDGSADHLGRVEPVAFSVQTVVVVAVPPGPRGVGDTGGDADERSPGWPGPDAALKTLADGTRNETQTTPPSIGSP